MTARSRRRAAEIAVIDAAVKLVNSQAYRDDLWRTVEGRALAPAVRAIEEIGLDETRQPATSNNAPETSGEAAASVLGTVGPLARKVFDEIAYVYRNDGTGYTSDQLETMLRRSHQSVSARVNELMRKGWIVDSGVRRKTKYGRRAVVWSPTALALRQS